MVARSPLEDPNAQFYNVYRQAFPPPTILSTTTRESGHGALLGGIVREFIPIVGCYQVLLWY